ncbi:MAG: hypothetical protein ACRDDX_02365 [Cellulosilyticaceae bacterium]
MEIMFQIQMLVMLGIYLVGGISLIVLMIRGIQALGLYKKKAKLEIQKLQMEMAQTSGDQKEANE